LWFLLVVAAVAVVVVWFHLCVVDFQFLLCGLLLSLMGQMNLVFDWASFCMFILIVFVTLSLFISLVWEEFVWHKLMMREEKKETRMRVSSIYDLFIYCMSCLHLAINALSRSW